MRRSRRISYLTQSYETNSGQEKGAYARRGDEVGRLVILTSIGLNLPLDCRLGSRMAIWPC